MQAMAAVVALKPLPLRRSDCLRSSRRVAVPRRTTGRLSASRVGAVAAFDPHSAASAGAHAAAHAHNVLSQLADATDGATAAAATATERTGFLNGIANGLEAMLEGIDGVLAGAGVPYSYGFSIILLTFFVKLATYPLSKKQMDSTLQMQAIAPRVRELQAKYANDQERLQMETARLYREANVNPLAGCLPTLATIPVFIGLYRALTNAAQDGLLTEGFFWIPSLGGPVALGPDGQGGGLDWLFPFPPSVGWADAGAYLLLPVLLVVSQYASQKIMQPANASDDPSQAQAQTILKILPVMIGWFALNVPSGLTLYWFTNNILTTGQTLWLRSQYNANQAAAGASTPASSTTIDVTPSATSRPSAPMPPPAALEPPKAAQQQQQQGNKPGSRFAALKAAEQAQKGGEGKTQRRGKGIPKGVKFVESSKEDEASV